MFDRILNTYLLFTTYSFFEKIEDINKIDSVAMQIYSF